jgi:multicomponent Na+:H+ antiporter subunit C
MSVLLGLYAASITLVLLGMATAALRRSLIKKVIGLGIMSNGIHLLFISMGYREGGIAPIVLPANAAIFSSASVDPLPQALVLTSIVIDLSITTLALMIIIWVHKSFGTTDSDAIRESRG